MGRLRAEPFTFCRVSTDDFNGRILAYVGEGELTNDPLRTFGGYGVVRVPNFQRLLRYICENGFEHHTAINLSQTAPIMDEALGKYLGWDVYYHNSESDAQGLSRVSVQGVGQKPGFCQKRGFCSCLRNSSTRSAVGRAGMTP